VNAFFVAYEILLLFMIMARILSGMQIPMAHEGNVSEKPMMEMQWI
jgi:hypothetical protein